MLEFDTALGDISQEISHLKSVPLGTILAWTPKPSKDTDNPIGIPDGWVPCDGEDIKEGIFYA